MIKRFLKRKADDPGDSGALNDLSFLLIIFFIAIAGFNVNKGFLMDLPSRDKPRVVQTDDLMKCALSGAGNIFLDGKPATLAEMGSAIEAKKISHPNMTFLLTVDPETPYQHVIDIIHQVRSLDVENFSFRMDGGTP